VRHNINKHGAWIYVVWNGPWIRGRRTVNGRLAGTSVSGQVVEHRAFATVDSALKYLHDKLVKTGEVPAADFEEWAACLAQNRPGATDCYYSCYPIVWYDPALDDGDFEVNDYKEWETALRYRKGKG